MLPQSLLYLKSSPEGRIGSLYVCLLIPKPSTCTTVVEKMHILKVTWTECVLEDPQRAYGIPFETGPDSSIHATSVHGRAPVSQTDAPGHSDTNRHYCSSSEALVFQQLQMLAAFSCIPLWECPQLKRTAQAKSDPAPGVSPHPRQLNRQVSTEA